MTVKLGHPDATDPLNQSSQLHRTSASSGHSESAIFNVHSFNLGDVSQVLPDTFLEFKAYKLVRAAGSSLEQDLVGEFRLSIAQMRLKSYGEKVRKSLGLSNAANMRQAGRFNIALTVLEQ